MKKLLLLSLIVMTALSCKNSTSEKKQSSDVKEETKAVEVKAKGKYSIKSGIVEYKADIMGFQAKQTLYFDNFGAQEATVIDMDIMGTTSHTVTLTKDGYVYNFDPVNKTGSKTPVMTSANVNFEDLTDEVIKDWNLKKEGKESVLGKECDKYSMNNESMSMTGYYWVWKGIALKVDANMSTAKMVMDATSFQENANIPADKFEIPSDIVFN